MASTEGAEKKIAFLLGLPKAWIHGERVRFRSSPAPISGGDGGVYSYNLPIVWREPDGYAVYDCRSSLTTNRHLKAARAVLERNGYAPTGEQREIYGRPYALYARPAEAVATAAD